MGPVWHGRFKMESVEWGKMRTAEKNDLYKVISDPNKDPAEIVEEYSSFLVAGGSDTYKEVMDMFPTNSIQRGNIENAVMDQLVREHTEEGALDAVALADKLNARNFTQPEAKYKKQVANEIATLYKTDVTLHQNLKVSTGDSLGVAGMSANLVFKAKVAVANSWWAAANALRNTPAAKRHATYKLLGKLLDNPLDAKSVKAFKGMVDNNPAIVSKLDDWKIAYSSRGEELNKGNVRLHAATGRNKQDTLTNTKNFVSKEDRDAYIKKHGAKKLDSFEVDPSLIMTRQQLKERFGSDLSDEALMDNKLHRTLGKEGKWGIEVGDHIITFDPVIR
jgi:hypothetical protein